MIRRRLISLEERPGVIKVVFGNFDNKETEIFISSSASQAEASFFISYRKEGEEQRVRVDCFGLSPELGELTETGHLLNGINGHKGEQKVFASFDAFGFRCWIEKTEGQIEFTDELGCPVFLKLLPFEFHPRGKYYQFVASRAQDQAVQYPEYFIDTDFRGPIISIKENGLVFTQRRSMLLTGVKVITGSLTFESGGESWVFDTAKPLVVFGKSNVVEGELSLTINGEKVCFSYFDDKKELPFLSITGLIRVSVGQGLQYTIRPQKDSFGRWYFATTERWPSGKEIFRYDGVGDRIVLSCLHTPQGFDPAYRLFFVSRAQAGIIPLIPLQKQ